MFDDCVFGNDPGGSGCLTAITRNKSVQTWVVKKGKWHLVFFAVSSYILVHTLRCVMFEEVGGRSKETKMTKPQIFQFGLNTGVMYAIFWFNRITAINTVEPQVWQRYFKVAGRVAPLTSSDAEDYKARKELYRQTAELRIGRPVTLQEGDSILIAIYAWEQTFGEKF